MEIIARYIHGSQDSIDRDVLYIVDRLPSFGDCVDFCVADKSENRNVAVICDGVISDCFKGFPDELNNSILATYPLHEQSDSLLITRAVRRDKVLKYLSVLRKFVMELRHTTFKKRARAVLKSTLSDRIELAREIDLRELEWSIPDEEQLERIKSIAFQLGQAIALSQNIEVYTKRSIFEQLPSLRPYLERRPCSLDALESAKVDFISILQSLNIRDYGQNTVLITDEDSGERYISLHGKEHDVQRQET